MQLLIKLTALGFSLSSVTSMIMNDVSFGIGQVTDGGLASVSQGPSEIRNGEIHSNINGFPNLQRRLIVQVAKSNSDQTNINGNAGFGPQFIPPNNNVFFVPADRFDSGGGGVGLSLLNPVVS